MTTKEKLMEFLNGPELGNDHVPVSACWTAIDVRKHFEHEVEHMTDDEIMEELWGLQESFRDACIESGWNEISMNFEIKKKE